MKNLTGCFMIMESTVGVHFNSNIYFPIKQNERFRRIDFLGKPFLTSTYTNKKNAIYFDHELDGNQFQAYLFVW